MSVSAIEAQPLPRMDVLRQLEDEHDIRGAEAYLLDVIPLVEMAWATGSPAQAERHLIYEFALRRLATIDHEAEDLEVVSVERVNQFLERFLDAPPPPGYLRRIRGLAIALILDPANPGSSETRRRQILEYCLDVGAAAVGHYPYGAHERFSEPKKTLLLDIIATLHLD